MNVNLSPYYEDKLERLVKKGIGGNKTEVVRFAIAVLEQKVDDEEDMLAIKRMMDMDADLKSGKTKLVTEKEALGKYAKYLE